MSASRTGGTDTPLGRIAITTNGDAIVAITWSESAQDIPPDNTLLSKAADQISAYFNGTRQDFDLPLQVDGSSFQRAVCEAMLAIPFGDTRTYGDLATQLGAPSQAVGQACGNNPIPIVIPCHRVLGARGLGGFSARGGVETKVALLRLEGAAALLI